MDYWIELSPEDDLPQVFDARELAVVAAPDNSVAVSALLDDVALMVREAIANNPSNSLDDRPGSIPRTLRAAALDIAALRLLKRFALPVTEERKLAYDKALELLAKVASGDYRVMTPDGVIPVPEYMRPAIVAPRPAYGNDGSTWYPTPTP